MNGSLYSYFSKMETILIFLLNDQPTTCPYCGARTFFDELVHRGEYYQVHFCLNVDCGVVFLAMEE